MKTKKILPILLALCICCPVLTACGNGQAEEDINAGNTEQQAEETAPVDEIEGEPIGEYLSNKFPLDSEEILIMSDIAIGKFEPWKVKKVILTDPEEIENLIQTVNYDAWTIHPNSKCREEEFAWIVVFSENTAVRLYSGLDYGGINKAEVYDTENELYCLKSSEKSYGYVAVNPEFTAKLKEILKANGIDV
jgi:hypothetical protein